jgi:serine/threonine-protein kinase HipA
VKALDVYLDGTFCGTVEQSSSGNLTFDYDEAYRTTQNATPLSLSMPLAATTHKKRAVLPFLRGLLPDSDEALRAMGTRFSVSANSPFALLEQVGSDVAGAVQLVPKGTAASDLVLTRGCVRAVSSREIATLLEQTVSEYTEGAPYFTEVGRFSLAGAQPKIALHELPDGGWGVPEDATPTTHILKPAVGSFRRVDVVETVTMRAAELLGNEVAQARLAGIEGWNVFVTRRYDRELRDGTWRRLHQEDLCQALSVSPDKKYQHRYGGPGLADIARLIRSLPFEADRVSVGQKFYRAVVFNILAGCTDAHAKNYSLLLDGTSVRLAPLYDLASYAAYWDGEARLNSAMNVGGEYGLEHIGETMLIAAGQQFGVGSEAREIVERTRAGMLEAFESACAELEDFGPEVRQVADDLLRGLRRLPLLRR